MHKLKEFRANLGLLLMDVFTKDPTINRVIIERFLSGQSVGTIHAEMKQYLRLMQIILAL